ncbi:glutamate--tRNA ligase [Compostibacter hankyongensis]|uniref:Glutamate--tRNA ligase n=1 Tax=Compostibacter hankyongensis TaxID=1007089 RepID=A0ABP8FTZ0_9BACT
MEKRVRVRFAPSPTGGLHLGGVRTVLFNYLFARQQGGDFILRIEDTDQARYVPGAEQYIIDCLHWCGLEPDEGPHTGGSYGPYRQSERRELYRPFAEQLVQQGHAYYAFDTPEELEAKRKEIPNFRYDQHSRNGLRNSLTLPEAEVQALLQQQTPHVIRIKIPEQPETVVLQDMIRGEVSFDTENLDDKVLLKADGMPTYHLAVVVDDHLMEISHVFRGEEWLPSAPAHVLLWRYLGWEAGMPAWAHLPLILKPDGNGKLSKRDGDRLGFPVYAMNWTDPVTGDLTHGFRELGFLPEAFVNMLALLGWNDGSGQEIFSLEELVDRFSIERIHKGGAKFDYEKARWFNHEYIKTASAARLLPFFRDMLQEKGGAVPEEYMLEVIELVKERCTLLTDLWDHSFFFFRQPEQYDTAAVMKKWSAEKEQFFKALADELGQEGEWSEPVFETLFRSLAESRQIKVGELQLPLRVMLCGGKFGPAVFGIAAVLGRAATRERILAALPHF